MSDGRLIFDTKLDDSGITSGLKGLSGKIGGIAGGIDRIAAILAGEDVIREAMAFPKTGDARDVMMGAPSQISEKQLEDVHISLRKEAQGKELKEAETKIDD